MGCNFYTKSKKCKERGSELGGLHLGKASMGWTFSIQANGYKYYKNWKQMKEWLKDKELEDEYGTELSLEDFIVWVESRKAIKDPEATKWSDGVKKIGGYKFCDYEFC